MHGPAPFPLRKKKYWYTVITVSGVLVAPFPEVSVTLRESADLDVWRTGGGFENLQPDY